MPVEEPGWPEADPWLVQLSRLSVRVFLYSLEVMLALLSAGHRVAAGALAVPPPDPFRDPFPDLSGFSATRPAAMTGRDFTTEPFQDGSNHETFKKERTMDANQDLSGDQVKVVQYCIVSVIPGIADDNRRIFGPEVVAFSDDMSSEDFTAWIIAEKYPEYRDRLGTVGGKKPERTKGQLEGHSDTKYLRVAFNVMGRFNKADIDWEELQAVSVARIAARLDDKKPS